MHSLFQMINQGLQPGRLVFEDKIISYFNSIYGSSRRTVLEYLQELELENKIIRKDGEIWTLKALNEKQELEDLEKLAQENQEKEANQTKENQEKAELGESNLPAN